MKKLLSKKFLLVKKILDFIFKKRNKKQSTDWRKNKLKDHIIMKINENSPAIEKCGSDDRIWFFCKYCDHSESHAPEDMLDLKNPQSNSMKQHITKCHKEKLLFGSEEEPIIFGQHISSLNEYEKEKKSKIEEKSKEETPIKTFYRGIKHIFCPIEEKIKN